MGRLALAVSLLSLVAQTLSAQAGPRRGSAVQGTVTGAGGLPLASVLITRGAAFDSMRSDSAGRYHVGGLGPGVHRLVFRHIGYAPSELEVEFLADTTIIVDVDLEGRMAVLDTIRVRDSSLGMYERKLHAVGFDERRRLAERSATDASFITPEDIKRRQPARLAYLLEGTRSVHIQFSPAGFGAIALGRGGRCVMTVWVDGTLFYPTGGRAASGGLSGAFTGGASQSRQPLTSGGTGLDGITITDVAAVEIYPSPSGTPPQFQSLSGNCGAIVVWTKQ